ncbi:MAG: hypothetical protein GY708_23760 [Actinomycetia bacterium]|nr:hypothetical protein [Actinomycetes bacterium]
MSEDDGDEERDPGESEDPWREESKDSFAAKAANQLQYLFQPGEDPDRIEFMGPCPRCAHPFVYQWPLEIVRTTLQAKADDVIPVTVLCQCTHAHPGRPEGTDQGCGAYWNLAVPAP